MAKAKIKAVRKFIVACAGIAIAVGLVDAQLGQAIVGAITAALVYFVPNTAE